MKKITLVIILFLTLFLLFSSSSKGAVIYNYSNLQVATPTPTPVAQVKYYNLQLVTPTATPAQEIMTVESKVNTIPFFVKVVSPKAGSILTSTKDTTISIDYGGSFDTSLPGTYHQRFELWRNGQKIGDIDNQIMYQLNIAKNTSNLNWKAGTYMAKDPNLGYVKQFDAPAGDGYSIKAIIYQYLFSKEENKDITTDLATAESGMFSLTGTSIFASDNIVPFGDFVVTPTSPAGGQTFDLGGSDISVNFDYSGPFRDSNAGSYRFRIELWKDGKKLGNTSTLDSYSLDPNKSSDSVNITPGYYLFPDPTTGVDHVFYAGAGEGYQFRVVLSQWYTASDGTTQTQDLTAATTGKFNLTANTPGPVLWLTRNIFRPVGSFLSRLRGYIH